MDKNQDQDRNTIVVYKDSGVWRAVLGGDPSTGRTATGKAPEEALAALGGRLLDPPAEWPPWAFDPDWQPDTGPAPAAPDA